jgi:hypothetical protein
MTRPYHFRPGGLMRCCLATLDEAAEHNPKEGDTQGCRYCKNGMRFKDGAWEWSGGPHEQT